MWEYLRAKQQEKGWVGPREKGFLSPGGTGEGKARPLHGQMSLLKPGEWGRHKMRIQKKASQELGLEEAKAQLGKRGRELRLTMASEREGIGAAM